MKTARRHTGRIRNAGFADVSAIFNLIKSNPKELVPRSQSDIIQNIDRFLVYEYRKKVVGVISWAILPEIERAAHPTVEIKSCAVQKSIRGKGFGRLLVAVRDRPEEGALAAVLVERLRGGGAEVVAVVTGEPRDARAALERLAALAPPGLDAVAGSAASTGWGVFADLPADFPARDNPLCARRSFR